MVARETDGPITRCTGLAGYGGDTARVYLLLTEDPALPDYGTFLATRIRKTGIGRAPRFGWRDGRLLVESAPSVIAELARQVDLITVTVDVRRRARIGGCRPSTPERGSGAAANLINDR